MSERKREQNVLAGTYWVEAEDRGVGDENQDLIDFTMALCTGLHTCGLSSEMVGDAAAKVAQLAGADVRIYDVPRTIIFGFTDSGKITTTEMHLINTGVKGFDFTKLIKIKKVADKVVWENGGSLREATQEIRDILQEPPRYDGLWEILGYILVAMVIIFIYEGGWQDLLAAMLLGFSAGVLSQWTGLGAAYEITAGFVLGTMAIIFHNEITKINIFAVSIAGIAQALPGVALTHAFVELAQGHLVAGSSRALYAILKLLSIAYGIIVAAVIWGYVWEVEEYYHNPLLLPLFPAFMVAGTLGFSINLQVPPKHMWIVFCTVTAASAISVWVQPYVGQLVGPLIGGVTVGVVSNLYSKLFSPHLAIMPIIAGIIMLVPGGLTLRGMFQFAIEDDTDGGIRVLFNVLLIATELAVALIIANILLPPSYRHHQRKVQPPGAISWMWDWITEERVQRVKHSCGFTQREPAEREGSESDHEPLDV